MPSSSCSPSPSPAPPARPMTPSRRRRRRWPRARRHGRRDKWIAGENVYWESGLPTGVPETCPASTPIAARSSPPPRRSSASIFCARREHGQKLLANAQNEWLAEEGARPWLAQARRRQRGASRRQSRPARGGELPQSHDDRPGHIAIVRPGNKTAEQIAAEGPDVIQAGSVNKTSISLKDGFAGHPAAWRDHEIAYYAHEVKL